MDATDVQHLRRFKADKARELKDLIQRLQSRDTIFDNIQDIIPAECVLL